MKLIIDDAHIDLIKKIYEYYPVDGVTTNPSILAKSGRQPFEVLKEIRSFIGEEAELHVQVVAKDADGMVDDAHRIVKELGANTYVKVPSIPEGFKAMKALSKENINITATAIYTPMQAYLAAKCGASYAAPYVNRIDNMGFNGIQVAKQIHDIFKNNNLKIWCNNTCKNSKHSEWSMWRSHGRLDRAKSLITGSLLRRRDACPASSTWRRRAHPPMC